MPVHLKADWEAIKPTLYHLYMEQDLGLPEVKRILKEEHSFDAGKRQFKTKFKSWGWRKNANEKDKLLLNKLVILIESPPSLALIRDFFKEINIPFTEQKIENHLRDQGKNVPGMTARETSSPPDLTGGQPARSLQAVEDVADPRSQSTSDGTSPETEADKGHSSSRLEGLFAQIVQKKKEIVDLKQLIHSETATSKLLQEGAAGLQHSSSSGTDTNARQGASDELYQPHPDLPEDSFGHNAMVAEEPGRAAPHAQPNIADLDFSLGPLQRGADDDAMSLSAMSVDNDTDPTDLLSMSLYDLSMRREYMAPAPAAGYNEPGGSFFNQGMNNPFSNPMQENLFSNQGLGDPLSKQVQENLFSNQGLGNMIGNPMQENLSPSQGLGNPFSNQVRENLFFNQGLGNLLRNPMQEHLSPSQGLRNPFSNQVRENLFSNQGLGSPFSNQVQENPFSYQGLSNLFSSPMQENLPPNQTLGNSFSNQVRENLDNPMFMPPCGCLQLHLCPHGWNPSRH